MRFPVETSRLRFTVAAAPEPVQRRPNERAPAGGRVERRAHADSWRVPLRVGGTDSSGVVRVTVAGDPHLQAGTPVTVEDLALLMWKRPHGCGWSLRARAILPEPRL